MLSGGCAWPAKSKMTPKWRRPLTNHSVREITATTFLVSIILNGTKMIGRDVFNLHSRQNHLQRQRNKILSRNSVWDFFPRKGAKRNFLFHFLTGFALAVAFGFKAPLLTSMALGLSIVS